MECNSSEQAGTKNAKVLNCYDRHVSARDTVDKKVGKRNMENNNYGGNNPNNNNGGNNNRNNGNNGGRNNRNGQMVMMFVLITLVALLFMSLISKWQTQMTAREISYTEFIQMVDEGKIESVVLSSQQIDITPKQSEDEVVPITYYTGYVGDEDLVPM